MSNQTGTELSARRTHCIVYHYVRPETGYIPDSNEHLQHYETVLADRDPRGWYGPDYHHDGH